MRLAALLLLLAAPALAEDVDTQLVEFLGGQGCVIGADSRAAARDAGFDPAQVDSLASALLASGEARREGDYVVLDYVLCQIRLPEITSRFTVDSPEIKAITSALDAYAEQGEPGCFLQDPAGLFDRLNGGAPGAGIKDYLNFLAANIMSGDLRFYSTSPLRTPVGFQVISGDCSAVPDIESIRFNHRYLEHAFEGYILQRQAETTCDEDFAMKAIEQATRLQGGDPDADEQTNPEVNAWLWFEFDLISMAAGWRDGMTGTEKGKPRPPLCHYP